MDYTPKRGQQSSKYLSQGNHKPVWQFPWLYKESFIFVAGIIFIGFILQFVLGKFDFSLLQFPVNFILLVGLCILLSSSFFFQSHHVITWLSSIPLAIALLCGCLLLSLAMGFVPQNSQVLRWTNSARLGLTEVTSSWSFVLIYFFFLVSLGVLCIKRLRFALKNVSQICFFLNHFGLWFVLLCAGLGYADIERYLMEVDIGKVSTYGYKEKSTQAVQLPVAIKLNRFSMAHYEPKLYIAHNETGQALPDINNPYFYQINMSSPTGKLGDWQVRVEEFIPKAVRAENETYREWPVPGSIAAARMTATHLPTGKEVQGWISHKNMAQMYSVLSLDDDYSLVMAVPEPKKFQSDVTIYTRDGQELQTQLVVNQPVKVGDWHIYQYGYDSLAREQTIYSTFELVYDPWLNYVYFGFTLMGLGALGLLWTGRKKVVKK